jgi:alkylation response protein AidB-like acyl-CoA dehydrogenase
MALDRRLESYAEVLDEDERAFRDEVIALLDEAAERGLVTPHQYFEGRGGQARELYRLLGARGWLSMGWPRTHGGSDAPVSHEFLLWDTLAYYRAARPDLGPGLIAHIVIEAGSADLQAQLLPGLADGSLAMSLGYSEPEAGSDLTHLRTRATRDGEDYVVRGHKIWTSEAQHAQKLWLLGRVGDEGGRRGLTLLVVDLDLPGITISPIPTIDGHQVNEVFLDDVRVPAANRVGDEGGAWKLIREALAVERLTQVLPGRLRRDVEGFEQLVTATGQAERADVRAAIVDFRGQLAVIEASALATVRVLAEGGNGVLEGARSKLLASRLCQEIPRRAVDLIGLPALLQDPDIPLLWNQSVFETIAGGTVEIMSSLIAREALDLPVTS